MSDASDKPPVKHDFDALFEGLKASQGVPPRPHGFTALPAPKQGGLWHARLQWVAAALVTIALAWLTFTRGGWVPLLSGADLGVHEFGHLIFVWAPPLLLSFAGTLLQVGAPLGLCAYFYFGRRDRFATIVTLAWAAENLNNVSVYIYDATRMVLPLFGDDGSGAGHDWHSILTRLDLLGSTDGLAHFVRFLSVLLFVIALGLAVWWFVQPAGVKPSAGEPIRRDESEPALRQP